MTVNVVGRVLKEMRGEKNQQQLALELNIARETVSKYETGRSRIPPDISRSLISKFNNPKFAITVRNEYTGTGPVWLDGPNVDLHRCSVREKTIEEIKEALMLIKSTSLSKPMSAINHFDYQNIEDVLLESAEAITALDHFIAVVCNESGVSYKAIWDKHYESLESAGYIGGI